MSIVIASEATTATWLIVLAACSASELFNRFTLLDKRVQGMPGEGLTHGPRAKKNARGGHHRFSRIIRHSPRDGLRLIARSPREPGFLAPVASRFRIREA